jgi:hypothetical protein|tara:strand:+ start:85 stop:285 length:201 start_codon:yes stop_codon:yes gene_type:complete
MVAVEMDMVVSGLMVILRQELVTSVAHNLLHITNVIMHIDTSHTLHGELEETVLEKVTEVLEVVKV